MADYTELPGIEATYKKEPTLIDHLHWQLDVSVENDRDKFIGQCIIGNIQPDGYLCANITEIAEIAQSSEEEVLNVLKVIQSFDPTGIAARSLKECLLLQAQALPERVPLLETLIESHLDRLEERYYTKIASEMKISLDKLIRLVTLIKNFNPKPGLEFSSEGIDYVTPDLTVIKGKDGYDISLKR